MSITIWIVYEIEGVVKLQTISRDLLPQLERVRVLSEGEWLNAYRWRGA